MIWKSDVLIVISCMNTRKADLNCPEADDIEGSKVMWVISENGISESDFVNHQNIGEFVKMNR